MLFEILLSGKFLTGLLVILTFTLIWWSLRRPPGMPPGPPILVPILGHMVNIKPDKLLEQLQEYRKKYGDIFSLKMGNKWWIVFNGYDTLRDAFIKNADKFSSRPGVFLFKELASFEGIVASNGQLWKEHRTFVLNKLRAFGVGKRGIESNILEEVKGLLKVLEEQKGKPLDIYDLIHASVANVTCTIAFGKRFRHTDPTFLKLIGLFLENIKINSAAGVLIWLPLLRHFPGDIGRGQKALRNQKEIVDFLKEIVREHQETYDENVTRDFIDAFISEAKQQENNMDSTFTEKQLIRTIQNLFIAGTETTSTTIRWALVYLIRNPDIQDKMRQEIENVVGKSELPRIQQRTQLPYTEAVITETLRLGDIAPLALFHGTKEDTVFKGYRIPKDAVLTPNLDSVLSDPKEFPDPLKFNPSRFIGEDGKFCHQEKVIPFSLGRRICLGESLARTELFLFLTSLVQRFQFLPSKDGQLPSMEPVVGITRSPRPFQFRAVSVN